MGEEADLASPFCPSEVLMSRTAWDAYLRDYGKLNVAAMLQQAPCNWQDEQGQRRYARLMVAWLRYEGALPPPLPPPPTPRQAKRAKAKEKKATQLQQQQQHVQLIQGACFDEVQHKYRETMAELRAMTMRQD